MCTCNLYMHWKNVSGINASTSTSYRRANDLANNEFCPLEILQLAVKLMWRNRLRSYIK